MNNSHEITFVFGFFVTLVNIFSVLCNSLVIIRQFKKVINVHDVKRGLVNFHFALLITSFAFLFGNGFALHRFFVSWIIDKREMTEYIMLNGFTDRIFMCITSIGILILSLLKVPFLIKDDR